MADDYNLLGLGGLTSLVTNVNVCWWGNEVLVECLYDPTGDRLPYSLLFKDCREIRWDVHDELVWTGFTCIDVACCYCLGMIWAFFGNVCMDVWMDGCA